MRTLLAAAALVAALSSPAFAGDYADRTIIGFSPDGARFAFSEFGVQDGSGFPYANVYVIDVDQDSWIDGTPIRVRIDDESATLATARADAMKQARPIIDRLNITAEGNHVVDNPATELSADPYAVRFRTNQWFNMVERPWDLKLTRIPMPGAKGCENYDDVAGFRLELTDPDGKTRVLHEDTSLPASRTCARDYAISDVILLPADKGAASMAVVISLIRQGFEGPDRRFIDLSHHQRAVDWRIVRDAGIVAVIHKATEGATFRDPAYRERRAAAMAVGLLWGSYHYAGTAQVADQVANYLACADPGPGDLVCIDYEPQPSGTIMTPSDLVDLAESVHARLGRWPVLYGSAPLVAAAAAHPDLARCPLWLPRYGDIPPDAPAPWPRWTLWQYTDGAEGSEPRSVPGIGACDRNVFKGTEAELRGAWPFGV